MSEFEPKWTFRRYLMSVGISPVAKALHLERSYFVVNKGSQRSK
jgi:hypothetical protein